MTMGSEAPDCLEKDTGLTLLPEIVRIRWIICWKCLYLSSDKRRRPNNMLKFSFKWLNLGEDMAFFSLCTDSIYSMNDIFHYHCKNQRSDRITGSSLSQQHCCLSSTLIPFGPLSLQTFWSQDLALLCWLCSWHMVSPVQTSSNNAF